MEDNRNREGEELAATEADISDSGVSKLSKYEESSSTRRRRELERHQRIRKVETSPSVEIFLNKNRQRFSPGGFLSCEYTVKIHEQSTLAAIESSVILVTEGKGDEDIGVHHFERRNRAQLSNQTFDRPQRMTTVLPLSPISYEGSILKVHWQVRVRIFLANGEDFIFDQPFLLNFEDQPCKFIAEN